jgi:hypothetical protein
MKPLTNGSFSMHMHTCRRKLLTGPKEPCLRDRRQMRRCCGTAIRWLSFGRGNRDSGYGHQELLRLETQICSGGS